VNNRAINERPSVEVHRINYSIRGPEWGFAIPQGDLEALREAMALCSEYWNGIGALIVPVRADGRTPPYLDWLLEVREVEQVFLHGSLGDRAKVAIAARFATGSIYKEMFDGEIHPLFLSLNGRPDSERKICRPIAPNPRVARIALACWGHIPEADLEDWQERYEVTEVRGKAVAAELLSSQINGRTPLQMGARYMAAFEQVGGFDSPPILYAIGKGNFEELVTFWNLRSRLAPRLRNTAILGVPRELLVEKEITPVLEWIETLRHGTYYKPDLSLLGAEPELSRMRTALRRHGFHQAPRDGRIKFSFPNPPEGRERLEYRPSISRQGPMKRGTQASALVTFSGRRALLDLPHPEEVQLPYGYVRLSIRGLPLALPMNSVTADKLIGYAEATQDGLRVKTDSGPRSWRWDLVLPSESEALEQWASAHGYAVEPSQPGRFGQALLNRLDRLEALDAVAHELALAILAELAPRSTKKLAQRIAAEIERRSLAEAGVNEELLAKLLREQGLSLQIEAKTLNEIASALGTPKSKLLEPIAGLNEAGLVRRGTRITCGRCNFAHTFALSEGDEWVRCRTCGERLANPVALGEEEYPRSYFLDGLAAQLAEQDMIPVILALRRAHIGSPEGASFFAWPGLLFSEGGNPPTDGDLLVSNGEQVRIYECKSRAGGLGEKQTQKLLALCERVAAQPGIAALEGRFQPSVAQAVLEAGGEVLEREELLTARPSGGG
jgi:hypothetical protein